MGHYPLAAREDELLQRTGLEEAVFYSSLEEPFFRRFGHVASLMEKLGMDPAEAIEHRLVSRAIRNAQENIASKISFEASAGSQSEWFARNLPQ